MDDVCELSLILPAFNEEAGVQHALEEADQALSRLGRSYEIIIIDDGSSDRTSEIVLEAMRQRPRVRLVRHEVNRGYGAALRSGFEASRGTLISFTDADCQFYLDDLALLISQVESPKVVGSLPEPNPLAERAGHQMEAGHQIAIGFRVNRQDPLPRKIYSRGYHLLATALLGTCARDIDCALKVFRRDALEKIMPETGGFFVNTEMLSKARQQGLSIAEVGVRHRARELGESKISLLDVPRVLGAMLPYWWQNVMFPGGSRPLAERAGHSRWLTLLLFAMTCVLFLARLDHPLLEPEEGRYAEIPRQMLAEGRWLTPVLHGEDYWQKPPMLYWLVMVSYQMFGVHDWAARLVPALAGIGCVAIVFAWGRAVLGYWTGLTAAVILGLSARFLYLAGMLSMDSLLCVFVLAGLAAGHLALSSARRRWWSLLLCAACTLGILTKGPLALVLILAPLAAFAWLDRRYQFWSLQESLLYGGIIALAASPWFVMMALTAPDAAGDFFWLHHLLRYFAPVDHEKPAWFYVPSLALGMMPWMFLAVPAAPYLLRKTARAARRRPPALGMFTLALVWCILFFSLSGCKRPGYILPAFPLLALMLGAFVTHGLPWRMWMHSASRMADRSGRIWARRLTLTACAMGIVCGTAAALAELWPWQHAAFLAGAFTLLAFIVLVPPARLPAWTSWAGCVAIMYFFLFLGQRAFLPDYHDRFGLRRQVQAVGEYEQEEQLPILTYPRRWDSVSFYSRRDDVESYTSQERAKFIGDLKSHGKAIVFLRRDGTLQDLLNALPAEMEIEFLGRKSDYVAVGVIRKRGS